MSTVHRSLFFSAIERYASTILFLVSTAALARLLRPDEFGVYALLGALTAVASASFQEFGGANYLIQKATLTLRDIRTAFTITFAMSLAFAAVLFALRGEIARFFSQDGLREGLAVLDLTFLLSPFAVTVSALLRRDMAFGTLARCGFVANVSNVVVSVILAAAGYSFMAPVWGAVAGTVVLTGLLMISRPDLRIFVPCLEGSSDVFRFGAYSSAVVIVNVIYQASPQFILGRMLGFGAVGLYGRTVSVTQVFDRLVVQVLNPVIMPAILLQTRTGGDLRRIYLSSVELIAVLQWPFLLFLALLAEPIVGLWLGPTWLPIVPLMQCLCVASLSLFAACLTYPVLVAVGRVSDTLTASVLTIPPSILLMAGASFFGVQAVAASALIALPLQAVVSIAFVGRALGFGPADFLHATRRSAVAAAAACVGPAAIVFFGPPTGAAHPLTLSSVLCAGLACVAGWAVGLAATRHPLLQQMEDAVRGLTVTWRRPRLRRRSA